MEGGRFGRGIVVGLVLGLAVPSPAAWGAEPAPVAAVPASLSVDGAPLGVSPLAGPVVVNAGRHTIAATRSGWSAATHDVDVVAARDQEVTLLLSPLPSPAPPPIASAPRAAPPIANAA